MDAFLLRRASDRLAQPVSSCPDAETLACALDETLTGSSAEAVSRHLLTCEACTTVARDFVAMRQIAASCPPAVELLRVAAGGASPLVEAHAAICAACAPMLAHGKSHADEAKALVDLLEAETKMRAIGVTVAASAVLAALLSRRAALGLAAQGRVHRSREGSLGVSAARPRHLTWMPFEQGEDTYEVRLETPAGVFVRKTHDTSIEIPADEWARLCVEPEAPYVWSVTALKGGRAGETQEGSVSFLAEAQAQPLAEQEALARSLEPERAMLALSSLYRAWNLHWEACDVLRAYVERHPEQPVGYLLMSQVCEEMERVQEASRALGQANRLMSAV